MSVASTTIFEIKFELSHIKGMIRFSTPFKLDFSKIFSSLLFWMHTMYLFECKKMKGKKIE